MDNRRSWLILHLLPDIGRARFHRLLKHFGSPEAALEASPAELDSAEIGSMAASSVRNWRELVDVDAEMRRIEDAGARIVCFQDEDYPANLRRMAVPPPLLYVRGTLCPIDAAAVAVIGSRKMSRYGREATREIAGGLARAGVTVVSGLALGVDGQAHREALDAGGRTLAVLGNGLSSVYPAQHARLAEEILERGALLSEMPMSAEPNAGSFPERNAIIAGLSLGVAVIEAGSQSGTSITAGHALEENRAVYAVPGDITRANSVGTNRLIQEGARLVTCARDILVDLRGELEGLLQNLPDLAQPEDGGPSLPADLSDAERRVYACLELDPLSIDVLTDMCAEDAGATAESAGGTAQEARGPQGPRELAEGAHDPALGAGAVMAALLNLEIRGLIRQEPGKMFRRIR
jgi:DNA processing protein